MLNRGPQGVLLGFVSLQEFEPIISQNSNNQLTFILET
jgi:hypothetical protein